MTKYISIVIVFILILLHLFLINKTFSIDAAGNFRAASAGYGDIPFHMTQVSKFAFQDKFDFNETIFDGERMRYAFGINLISGFLLRYSNNWVLSMQVPAMFFMAGGIILTFISYRFFLKSSIAAAIALAIFLLGSGFGTSYLLNDYSQNHSVISGNFIQYITDNNASSIIKWDAIYPEQNIVWGAPLSLVFLHQRAFFLGFFLFSLFWFLLWRWIHKSTSFSLSVFIGYIVGITPLSHYHTFVTMLVTLSISAFYVFISKKKNILLPLIIIGILIFVLAIPQVLYLIEGKNNISGNQNSFVNFRIGWMGPESTGSIKFKPNDVNIFNQFTSYLNFLWINFGVILPIFLISVVVFLKSQRFRTKFQNAFPLLASASTLFLLVQLFRFQPWDFDNNKLLVYFQFFAAPVTVAFFLWLRHYWKKIGLFLFALFIIIALHSGIVDLIPRLLVKTDQTPVIFGKDAVSIAEFIKTNIPKDKKIITTSTHLNPVASLAGRPAYVGYGGWLWTRGIDYGPREKQLKVFYGNPELNYLKMHFEEAGYVLLDSSAINDWGADEEQFGVNFTRVFKNKSYSLYKLR